MCCMWLIDFWLCFVWVCLILKVFVCVCLSLFVFVCFWLFWLMYNCFCLILNVFCLFLFEFVCLSLVFVWFYVFRFFLTIWYGFCLRCFFFWCFWFAKPSQAKPSQAGPSQAKPSQAGPSQAKPSRGGILAKTDALKGAAVYRGPSEGAFRGGGRYLKSRFVCPGAATASPCPSHARTTRTPLTGYFPFGDPSPQTPIHIYLFQNYRKVPFRPAAPKVISASAAGPQNSWKPCCKSTSLFWRFWLPKWLPKWSRNHDKADFASSSASHSVFPSFWHPKWTPERLKAAILLRGNKHFHKSSLFLLLIVLAPKSRQKQFQNHSKTPPKSIPKTHRNSTSNFIDFGSEMTPHMRPEILKKSTPGALRGHMWPKLAQKGGPGPSGDPKGRCRPPLGYNFPNFRHRFLMFFNIIHDFFSTCNCRLNRPRRITKPIAYRLKRPRATGLLVKSTVDDHDHGRRPRATTTGDGPPGENDHDHGRRPRPRATDH